jgi:hypothetical protein
MITQIMWAGYQTTTKRARLGFLRPQRRPVSRKSLQWWAQIIRKARKASLLARSSFKRVHRMEKHKLIILHPLGRCATRRLPHTKIMPQGRNKSHTITSSELVVVAPPSLRLSIKQWRREAANSLLST